MTQYYFQHSRMTAPSAVPYTCKNFDLSSTPSSEPDLELKCFDIAFLTSRYRYA